MNTQDAVALIAGAVPRGVATWADIGAGEGTFTRALAELLAPRSRIYAVDRDARAVAALERRGGQHAVGVIPVTADFTQAFEFPGLDQNGLDGMLLANALHFVRNAGSVLARLAERVRAGGRLVLVEYDGRAANCWVPYPIPATRLPELAAAARLSTPTVTATRPSAFGGNLYVAAAERLGAGAGGT